MKIDIENLRKVAKNMSKDNDAMRENTKQLKERIEKMDDKASLCFGIKMLAGMINSLDTNINIIVDKPIRKALDVEDCRNLLLAEINVIEAYENMQDVMSKTCDRLIDTVEKEAKETKKKADRSELSDDERFRAIVEDFMEFVSDIMEDDNEN